MGIAIFESVMAIITSIPGKKQKNAMKHRIKELGAQGGAFLRHVAGLPVSEGAVCGLFLLPNAIAVESNASSFYIGFGQITEITVKTDVEVREAYVSSAGGALAGGIMFGALGAMVGGRTKKKTTRNYTKFLIIGYNPSDGGQTNFASFEYTPAASIFVKAFEQMPRQVRNIQL